MTTTVSNGFLSGFSLGAGEDESGASKKARLADFGELSGAVDTELLEQAVELAKLINLGAARCADIKAYNAIALTAWKANLRVFSALVAAGADRELLIPPFQPAFFTTPDGVEASIRCLLSGEDCQSVSIKTPCASGVVSPRQILDPITGVQLSSTVVIDSDSRYADLFLELQPSPEPPPLKPANGLGALGVPLAIPAAIVWGLAILTVGTIAVLLTDDVLGAFDGSSEILATAELTDAQARLATSQFAARRECIEAGGSASECTALTNKAFATPAGRQGFFDKVVMTGFKLGALYLGGRYILSKMEER